MAWKCQIFAEKVRKFKRKGEIGSSYTAIFFAWLVSATVLGCNNAVLIFVRISASYLDTQTLTLTWYDIIDYVPISNNNKMVMKETFYKATL